MGAAALMHLNPLQAAAALDAERHVLVAAGAGTGKTRCVVARLLYLLGVPVAGRTPPPGRRVALRDLAAITFTNAAAADLQRQLRQALLDAGRADEAARVDTARIGTIHAFCGQLLWEFALQVPRPPGLEALDEGAAAALGADAARDALVEALEAGDLPGLDLLLDDLRADDVLRYTARLAADADRLRLIARDPELDRREQALVALAGRALAIVGRRLADRGAVDFDAMIVLARDLVRERPDVRRALQRRIHTLIVDEYQDVDPAQHDLVWALGEPETGRPDTTRLMLVGDPKQSIFRFRRSDVTIWTRVRRAFGAGLGAVHAHTENHRSRQPILAFVDTVIGPALNAPVAGGPELADYEVPYQPLDPAPALTTTVPCVELLVLPSAADGKARAGEEARSLEIPAAAARIRELVDGGTAPGDIAVLLPAWAPAAAYREALAAVGLRSWTLRNEGYWERREVVDCIVALQAVLDPQDDLALFGFLRGPMVGVRDETLLALARRGPPPYWRWLASSESGPAGSAGPGIEEEPASTEPGGAETIPPATGRESEGAEGLPPEPAESQLLEFAAGVLRRARALRDRVGPDALLRWLLDRTGFLAHLALLGDDGRQGAANVRKLLRLLGGWRDRTLATVLRLMADLRERDEGRHEGDAPLAARRDAVTITSIHSAKGLQWPVVVWADLARGPAGPDYRFLIGRSTVRLRDPRAERAEDDQRFAALRDAEVLEEHAQRKRLWYVAATRARERLILAGVPLGDLGARHAGTPAAAIRRLGGLGDGPVTYRDYRGEAFEALVRVVAPGVTSGGPEEEPAPVLPPESLPEAWPAIAVPVGRGRHSASELVTFARCRRKHWFIYGLGLREPPIERTGSAEFLDAVTRGQIVHDVLEELRALDGLDRLLEEAIGRWDPEPPPPEGSEGDRYRARLRDEIRRVADHPEYRAVAELAGGRRELEFVQVLADGRVVQGVLDLAAEQADGSLVLLDVKTGPAAHLSRKAVETRAKGYGPQRDVYVGAVEAIAGRSVERFAFHFSGSNRQVVTPVTPAVRAEAAARVAGMLKAIADGESGMTATPQECRFCGFRVARWCPGVRRRCGAEE